MFVEWMGRPDFLGHLIPQSVLSTCHRIVFFLPLGTYNVPCCTALEHFFFYYLYYPRPKEKRRYKIRMGKFLRRCEGFLLRFFRLLKYVIIDMTLKK